MKNIEGNWIIFDIMTILINFLDIFIDFQTKLNEKSVSCFKLIKIYFFKRKSSELEQNISRQYFNNSFLVDMLSFFPFDYCLFGLTENEWISRVLRVIYFFKYKFLFLIDFETFEIFSNKKNDQLYYDKNNKII